MKADYYSKIITNPVFYDDIKNQLSQANHILGACRLGGMPSHRMFDYFVY